MTRSLGRRELAALRAQLDELDRILLTATPDRPVIARGAMVKAARRLNCGAGVLAGSVLFDSAIEHYRGSFENRAMFAPLIASALSIAVSLHGTADRRPAAHRLRDVSYAIAAGTGIVGTGFHIYNILKRPGAMAWQNFFYGAPIGAPAALLLSGLLGLYSERTRASGDTDPRVLDLPAGRTLAVLTGLGLLGTSGEAGLLHFRGAYHSPFMFAPVTIPPVAAGLLFNAASGERRRDRWFARWWLRLTAAMGFAGVGFHAYGVSRNMGGFRNWLQTILNGPPMPAPPSFAGLALVGLAALGLMEDHPDA